MEPDEPDSIRWPDLDETRFVILHENVEQTVLLLYCSVWL